MNIKFLLFSFALNTVSISLLGCGGDSTVGSSSAAQKSTAEAETNGELTENLGKSDSTSDLSQQDKVDEQTVGTEKSRASTDQAKTMSVPKDAPIQVKPIEQQLSNWNLTEFEPLQMIAYRDHDQLGLVAFISMVNNAKEYLLGGTRLTLWSVADSRQLHEFLGAKTEDDQRLLSFAVSRDGTWCVVGDAGGLLRKFDIPARREAGSKQSSSSGIVGLAISPDGREITTGTLAGDVTVWDSESLETKSNFKADVHEVNNLQYSTPGILLVAGDSMSTWDTASGLKLKSFPSQKHQNAIALSPDRKQLWFGADEFLQRWSLADNKANGEIHGVPYRSAAIRFSDDGALVAVATSSSIQILDAISGRQLQFIDASGSPITDICWIPKSQAFMVSTDWGRNRIWGRADECRRLGIEPVSPSAVNTNVKSNEPANAAQNLAILDLRSLHKPPDAKSQSDSFASLNYVTHFDAGEVHAFYRYVLGRRGWSESAIQSTANTLFFSNNGYIVQLSSHSTQPSETYISLSFLGNHDLAKLPRYHAVKETTFTGAASLAYRVEASLLEVESELLRTFHAEGWTNVIRLGSRQDEDADSRQFEFLKAGTVVRVMVQRDKTEAKLLNIDYMQSLSAHALPVPHDAGVMEWDDYAEGQMVANTAMTIEDATAFYEVEMPRQGWVSNETGRKIENDLVYLPFYRNQHDLTVALEKIDGGLVRIRSGKYSQHSWQKPDDDEASEDSQPTPGEPIVETQGIEAADIPILHASGSAEYDSAVGSIRIPLDKTPLIEIAQEYETALAELGWKAKPFGDPTEKYINLHFEMDSKTIYYQSSINPIGQSQLRLSGNGLKWTKPIATSQPISYAAWLRNQKLPASLKWLSQYESEMSKIGAQ